MTVKKVEQQKLNQLFIDYVKKKSNIFVFIFLSVDLDVGGEAVVVAAVAVAVDEGFLGFGQFLLFDSFLRYNLDENYFPFCCCCL
jgi:hypothetical protein